MARASATKRPQRDGEAIEVRIGASNPADEIALLGVPPADVLAHIDRVERGDIARRILRRPVRAADGLAGRQITHCPR